MKEKVSRDFLLVMQFNSLKNSLTGNGDHYSRMEPHRNVRVTTVPAKILKQQKV